MMLNLSIYEHLFGHIMHLDIIQQTTAVTKYNSPNLLLF